ncbi:DUF29 domain-containing protein [Rhodoferax sp. 4810]|uniref:DUF29 domain-containing protein n=1 Tax=Thiospirillum jenense TaxID=1653858 RepID=A0A839HGB6_9GAMM|nr:DUF29 domain-containing protein [Thiospirillum jenense]MBB1073482.1 DUF29 domain-containing protein [Rhodoferax jenense]MBB1125969.1 DUF29 domain-containing protein [Thiospirillum jenense]
MTELNTLYDSNYSAWATQTAELLRAGRFAELDIEHLLIELSDMSKSDRRELANRLLILLAHLLKWQYQYHILSERWREFKGDSWQRTIIEQRKRIAVLLRQAPGLKAIIHEVIADVYSDAADLAHKETHLPMTTFPVNCPYQLAQLLDDNYYPEAGCATP